MIRSARLFPGPIVPPRRVGAYTANEWFFTERGGLVSLLSCLAPGRPLHLEGEAARPFL